MVGLSYLAFLLISIIGLVLIDRRFSLAFFYNPRRASITLLLGMLVFVLWDIFGIGLGIFLSGDSRYASGIMLGPHFPIEEVLFLFFFCYLTLVLYRLGEKKW